MTAEEARERVGEIRKQLSIVMRELSKPRVDWMAAQRAAADCTRMCAGLEVGCDLNRMEAWAMPTDDDRREVARSCDRCEYRPVCSTRRTCRDSAWCCSAYKKRIDRDALLAQVKELERCAWYFGLDFDADEPLRDRLKEASEDFAGCARRIREALGVSADADA